MPFDCEDEVCFRKYEDGIGRLMSESGYENRDSFFHGDFLTLDSETPAARDDFGVEGIETLPS